MAKADSIEHTHIWATKYDDKNHWEYCTVCGAVKDKKPHTLVSNGQSIAQCTNYYGNAYREVCKCGYQSKPFVVFHGRLENFKDSYKSTYLNYCLNTDSDSAPKYKMTDFLQISKQEFNDHLSELNNLSCISGGQKLDWVDDDGDGYGWVFCGGPILKSDGVKGSLELIIGSEGDCGRKSSFDENYALVRYFNSTSSPTRQGFVNWLKTLINKSSNPTRHLLYGYDDKYQNKVTDEQFNKIIAEYKGYWVHAGAPGWSDSSICHDGHQAAGAIILFSYYCYDSGNDHIFSQSDGIKTDCDLCGAHWTGNEAYESKTWYNCDKWKSLKEGQQITCSGHKVYGREYMGTIYDTFTRKNGEYYRTVKATAAAGYKANVHTSEIQLNRRTSTEYSHESSGYVRFSNGTTGRDVLCYYVNPPIDEDPPVINTVTMTPQTYSNGWATISQFDVSGTENYCNMVYLTITNKLSGKVMLDNAVIQVVDKKYSYSATPQLEGSENGTVYTVSVKDLYGNVSTKDFTVYKTDGTAPQTESKLSYTDWTSTAKTITLTFTDYGSGGVQTSFNDQTHYQACTKTADGKYQVTYTFSDNITGTKDYMIYVKDALGNAASYTLAVGNIDKNVYSITYNLNGGAMNGQKTSYTVTDSFTLPQPTRTGYTFTGWTGSNGTTPQKNVIINKGTRGNLSYTANWQVNTYKNHIYHWLWGLKNGEGTNDNKDAFQLGTTAFQSQYEDSFIMDSTKAVKIPNGFSIANFGTDVIDNTWKDYPVGTKVQQKASDMYFEYRYNPISYSIAYNLNGGANNNANPSAYNVLYGVTLANPTKPGSSFDGWYENMIDLKSYGVSNNRAEVSIGDNKIIFANSLSGNMLNYCSVQIWDENNTSYEEFAVNSTANSHASAVYKHTRASGKYYLRIKANGNKEDRSLYVSVYLEQSKTYNLGFKLDSLTAAKAIISDVYFTSSDRVTGINERCNAAFSSTDDLYAQLAKRKTGDISLVALWKYDTVHVKVPQVLVGDHTGRSQFRVKCDDLKSGNIKVAVPNSFPYKQAGKSDVTASINSKSGNNTITPANKVCVYDITAKSGLSAGGWRGSFNIGLTLTKE